MSNQPKAYDIMRDVARIACKHGKVPEATRPEDDSVTEILDMIQETSEQVIVGLLTPDEGMAKLTVYALRMRHDAKT